MIKCKLKTPDLQLCAWLADCTGRFKSELLLLKKYTQCEIFLLQEFLRGCGCWLFLVPDKKKKKKTGHKFPSMHPTFPLSFSLFNLSICPHLHRNYLPISPHSEGSGGWLASNEAASSQPGNPRCPPVSFSHNNRTVSGTTSDYACEPCATLPPLANSLRVDGLGYIGRARKQNPNVAF